MARVGGADVDVGPIEVAEVTGLHHTVRLAYDDLGVLEQKQARLRDWREHAPAGGEGEDGGWHATAAARAHDDG